MSGRPSIWPDVVDRDGEPMRFAGSGQAMNAVSRLLRAASDAAGPAALHERLVAEALSVFRVTQAVLLSVDALEGRAEVAAASPAPVTPPGSIILDELPGLEEVVERRLARRADGSDGARVGKLLGAGDRVVTALLLPMRQGERVP